MSMGGVEIVIRTFDLIIARGITMNFLAAWNPL